MNEFVIGIDLGTQGACAVAVTADGQVLAKAYQRLSYEPAGLPEGWFEQDPRDWWAAVAICLRDLMQQIPSQTRACGISVDSTSGTILPVDTAGEPLHPAIMYNDRRSEALVQRVCNAGAELQTRLGYAFNPSFALPKLLWLEQERPELRARTAHYLHAADYIVGRLSGEYTLSDTSNALKTGYDLQNFRWPDFIEEVLGIPRDKLPRVLLPGQRMAQVSKSAAVDTGLPEGTPIFAGATDGTAAQFASGASQPGDWNSTLGTTLVFKGISKALVLDEQGRIYSHLHPEGWWMPGGASNTGAEWITRDQPGADPALLDRAAREFLPSPLLRYPLCKQGERFPFIQPSARGFLVGAPREPAEIHAAGLEGVAMLERLAYEMMAQIGLEVGEKIFITGGGAHSAIWSEVRASLLGKVLVRPVVPETAMGAAVLAASGCWYGSLSQAASAVVKHGVVFEPRPDWIQLYSDQYQDWKGELVRRGWLGGEK
jgi:sugar (pentulose or hexulose) kinase